ncbi:MAG: hypothetical protein GC181_11355 [Bacteroidetes bacterium]|nr:hypothetical protein [Bacteroidota bacterium]
MKENTDHEKLFDLLLKGEFKTLTPLEKSFVLMHLSEEEFTEMQHVNQLLEKDRTPLTAKGMDAIKSELLAEFDKKHGKHSSIRPLRFWQAAAVILFLLLCGFVFRNIKNSNNDLMSVGGLKVPPKLIHDTVYMVQKTSPPEMQIVHDTLFVFKNEKHKGKIESQDKSSGLSEIGSDIFVRGADQVNEECNRLKGNSLKDDSLVQRFGFVSL